MRLEDSFPDVGGEDLAPAPIERARTIPAAWCVEPRFHALDREAVTAASWQPIGTVETLRQSGALVATVAGRPVIGLRGGDGALAAFHNVCRHRGGPLAPKAGASGVLQCRYHGWTYRTDGTLLGAPRFTARDELDPGSVSLPRVDSEEWQGHVFVRLALPSGASSPPPSSLAARLAGLEARLGPASLAGLRFARRVEYDVCCNWKVYVDNYLEGYHVPLVHPELMRLYDIGRYRTELHDGWSLQVGPLSGAPNLYTAGGGEALYAFLFPNVMLNVLPGRLQTNLVVPEAPERCRVVFDYFYEDVASGGAAARIEADLAFSDRVQREDVEICERVQEGLASGSYDRGRFCATSETAVHHFQEALKAAYRRFLAR